MKKVFLTAAVLAMAFAVVPSHAQGVQPTATSCIMTPDMAAEDTTCTFTSTGLAIQYVIATPNHWSIVATFTDSKGEHVRKSASAGSASTNQGPGTLTGVVAGDTVTVTEGNDCAGPACGEGGFVIAGEVN